MAGAKLADGDDHARRCSAIGDDIHHTGGIQLHHQHLHGDLPEPLRLLVHLPGPDAVTLVYLQRGQTLKIFQKAVPQFCVNSPIPFQKFPGYFLYRHDGYRYQRHTNQQHQTCLPVDKGKDYKQCHRRRQTVEQLGQIFPEIRFQLFHSFGRHLHHFRSRYPFPVRSPQPQELSVNLLPQDPFHIHAGRKRSLSRLPVTEKTQRHSSCSQTCVNGQPLFCQRAENGSVQRHGHGIGDQYLTQQRKPLPQHLEHNVFFPMGQKPDQSFFNHKLPLF